MSTKPASWSAWIAAYEKVLRHLPEEISIACPNCNARTLRVAYFGSAEERLGYASFWCNTCLFGIHLSRVCIPEGMVVHPFGVRGDERRKIVPKYVRVNPADEGNEDDEDGETFIL